MSNRWNVRDLLRLTRNCELGMLGDLLHVVKADGSYMTVRRPSDGVLLHTGRDYVFAVKIGEGAVDDESLPLFKWARDTLVACETKLNEVERRLRGVPTARRCAIRLAEVCDRLEEIVEEFAGTDRVSGP